MGQWRIGAAGDSAMVVEFGSRMDPAINSRAIAVAAAIRTAGLDGVRDVVSAYCSVTVYFDPLRTNLERLTSELERGAAAAPAEAGRDQRVIAVPVCYGGEYGPDLNEVARFGDRTEDEVVRIHAGEAYRVYMLGFVPGFTYMGRVDARIAMPRRPQPRLVVPAGSVGIAGLQTGIYPVETPGGWRLVGRTPIRPFDPTRAEPFLFKSGDTVRFEPIDESAFRKLVEGRP